MWNLCLTCSFLSRSKSRVRSTWPREDQQLLHISAARYAREWERERQRQRMRESVSKPIKDIKQTFCKIKCHARQAHVLCLCPGSLSCSVQVCTKYSAYYVTLKGCPRRLWPHTAELGAVSRVGPDWDLKDSCWKMLNIFKYLWAINTWAIPASTQVSASLQPKLVASNLCRSMEMPACLIYELLRSFQSYLLLGSACR